jgi:hypothetical protein
MKKIVKYIWFSLSLVFIYSGSTYSQRWVDPHFDTHRMDYRDLGYPATNLIPADNSQITALLTHSDGFIYGATSGKTQSYLFYYNRYINKVRPLGKIADAKGIYHNLLEGNDGKIYIGGGLNMLAPLKLTSDFKGKDRAIEYQLWEDICTPYSEYEGGHIYVYDPKTGNSNVYRNEDACPVIDLGIPVAANTIYAMIFNNDRKKIYGITYPDAHFFIFDIKSKKTRDFGDILTERVFGGPERHWRSVPRALYCSPKTGRVYTSGDNGLIICYNPEEDVIAPTQMRLPGDYFEGLNYYAYPVVENFDTDNEGNIYAGTSDGYLINLDIENDETIIIGKPRIMRRLRAMKVGNDSNIYMISGEFERTCKLHTYDLSGKKGFSELGPLSVERSPYYARRPYEFDAMAIGHDGSVFCGESDRGGKLFIYIPGPGVFKGHLNPQNPPLERMRPMEPIPGPK